MARIVPSTTRGPGNDDAVVEEEEHAVIADGRDRGHRVPDVQLGLAIA